jgi:hypothetical protein
MRRRPTMGSNHLLASPFRDSRLPARLQVHQWAVPGLAALGHPISKVRSPRLFALDLLPLSRHRLIGVWRCSHWSC